LTPAQNAASLIRRRWQNDNSGLEEEQMADVRIVASKNGPYIVTGSVDLTDAAGKNYQTKTQFALCRCGASTTKPFCDGTHSKIGFQAAEQAVPESAE
jgi:3-phenylpropionate/trans-cinnamate dioxygenase ferredoxin subunit